MGTPCGSFGAVCHSKQYCDPVLQTCNSCVNLCNLARFGGEENVKDSCKEYCPEYFLKYVDSTQAISDVVTKLSEPRLEPVVTLEQGTTVVIPVIIAVIATLVIVVAAGVLSAVIYKWRKKHKGQKMNKKYNAEEGGIELQKLNGGDKVNQNNGCSIEDDSSDDNIDRDQTIPMKLVQEQTEISNKGTDPRKQYQKAEIIHVQEVGPSSATANGDARANVHQNGSLVTPSSPVKSEITHIQEAGQSPETANGDVRANVHQNGSLFVPPSSQVPLEPSIIHVSPGPSYVPGTPGQQNISRDSEVSFTRTQNTPAGRSNKYSSANQSHGTSGYNSNKTEGGKDIVQPTS